MRKCEKNLVSPDRSQTTIQHGAEKMRFEYGITKVKIQTRLEYVIVTVTNSSKKRFVAAQK
jgi:hypothetical protein